MKANHPATIPMRITDIVEARRAGASVDVQTCFQILPVDFRHAKIPFQAYIFLVLYSGGIDAVPFGFRKCYARGCPNNLCTHVSQAVTIANRYLQRDYQRLAAVGIDLAHKLFSLDDMVVQFERLKESGQSTLTLPELVGLAQSGRQLSVSLELEFLSAVEHFANQKNAQTYLSGEITTRTDEQIYRCHRCFACFPTERSGDDRSRAVTVANARLELMFQEFGRAGIVCQKQFFD